MRNKLYKIAPAALALALTFTFFACSSDPEPSPTPPEPSSDSSGGQMVFCKRASGNCSQMSLSTCMDLVNAGEAQIVQNCDAEQPPTPPPSSSSAAPPPTTPSSSSVAPPPPSSSSAAASTRCKDTQGREYFCQWGNDCWSIDPTYSTTPGTCSELVDNCNRYGRLYAGSTREGENISCNGTYVGPSSSSVAPTPSSSSVVKPSKMIIELTHYEETSQFDGIGGYGDPGITVKVTSKVGDFSAKTSTTKSLLREDNIAKWNGSAKDTVEIYSTADTIRVNPIILDYEAVGSPRDFSPPGKYLLVNQIFVGNGYSGVVFSNDKVSCTLNLNFIK